VTQGRTVLDRVLGGPIVFTPTPDTTGCTFEAPTRFDRLFSGVAIPRASFVPLGIRTGTEGIGPGDTFDLDYGRLLEQAARRHRTEVASPHALDPLSLKGVHAC
jgi:hypothetical protein